MIIRFWFRLHNPSAAAGPQAQHHHQQNESWLSRLVCAVLAAFTVAVLVGPVQASPVTMTAGEIGRLRALVAADATASKQFEKLRAVANAALQQVPKPVITVVSEGHLAKDPEKIQSTAALEDMKKVEALAWTWAVTGDERYAAKARIFISAWVRTNQSDGNPINETKFEPMVEAYDLVRDGYTNEDERTAADHWLRGKAVLLTKTTRGERENWQSHRIKMIGLVAATIGDEALWQTAVDGFRTHLRENFKSDGRSIDFSRRDALHYHLYSVQPLLTLACVAERRGVALFREVEGQGASLERAVEFVRPYALGKKQHIEFEHSQVRFDQRRASAGEEAYRPAPWKPKASVSMYSEAGCIDEKYDEVASSVAGRRLTSWRAVLNASLSSH